MNKNYLLRLIFTASALMAISACKPESKDSESDSVAPTTPSDGGGQTGLRSSYCAGRFIQLNIADGQYTLIANDLGNTPIAMSGAFENGILQLSGEHEGRDLVFLGAITPDGSVMSTNIMVMDNGMPRASIKSMARAGACPTTTLDAIPKLAVNPVNLADINKISRFRSSAGHNYSDSSESCRSMKHYFEPLSQADRSTEVYAPFRAIVIGVYNDDGPIGDDQINNQHITLQPLDHPAIQLEIFHTELAAPLTIGTIVEAGAHLAWADLSRNGGIGSDFDFAVHVNTAQGMRLISLFDLMTDEAFADYTTWSGLNSRDDFKITKADRDSNPLQCSYDSISQFSGGFVDQNSDTLGNQTWIVAD